MSRVRHLFTRDLGRKIFALLLAMLVWWRVHLSIEFSETINFVIATERVPSTDRYVLEIEVPRGWQLVVPKPGSPKPIELKGVQGDLRAFLGDGIRVRHDPRFTQPDETTGTYTSAVDIDDLDWHDTMRADLLLRGAKNAPIELTFERLQTRTVTLSEALVPLEGELDAGFDLAVDRMVFTPTSVGIEGPFNAVNELNQDPLAWGFSIFEPTPIAGERSEVRANLRLTEAALEYGLRLVEPEVRVEIPVYPEILPPFVITPPASLELLGDPTDPGTSWEVDQYGGCSFEVRYRHDPAIDPIPSEEQLRASIIFFVDLSGLPAGADTGDSLPVNWAIHDRNELADPQRRQALKHAITLRPLEDLTEDPSKGEVTLRKLD